MEINIIEGATHGRCIPIAFGLAETAASLGGYSIITDRFSKKIMTDPIVKQLADAINHNAGLLERHLTEGIYVHSQGEPAQQWQVTHSLGSLRPLIETYDTSGHKIGHGVIRETQTHDFCEITFQVPMAGTAILRF